MDTTTDIGSTTYLDLGTEEREPLFFYLLNAYLQSRIDTDHESDGDEEVNVYLAGLLHSLVDGRFYADNVDHLASSPLDVCQKADECGTNRGKTDVYRTNADHRLMAFGLFAAPILGVEAVGPSILYIGALAWIAIAMGSFLAVALIIRFDVTNLLSAPFFLMFAAIFGVDWVVSKLLDDPLASFQAFVAMPWAPHIVAGLLAISLLSLVGLSFVLAKQGIERYRPTPDAIGW